MYVSIDRYLCLYRCRFIAIYIYILICILCADPAPARARVCVRRDHSVMGMLSVLEGTRVVSTWVLQAYEGVVVVYLYIVIHI